MVNEDENEYLRAFYPFIRKDIRLCAEIHKKTGKQRLIMQKLDLNKNVLYEESINCIHTAVKDIPTKEFEDQIKSESFYEDILIIRSTENITPIHLNIEERFLAFKSWVSGIAEAGIDALKIQSQLEIVGRLLYPIVYHLIKFLSKVDLNFLYEYLDKIQKECVFEGVKYDSFLISNLVPILGLCEDYKELIDFILELNPPFELFLELNLKSHRDRKIMAEFVKKKEFFKLLPKQYKDKYKDLLADLLFNYYRENDTEEFEYILNLFPAINIITFMRHEFQYRKPVTDFFLKNSKLISIFLHAIDYIYNEVSEDCEKRKLENLLIEGLLHLLDFKEIDEGIYEKIVEILLLIKGGSSTKND